MLTNAKQSDLLITYPGKVIDNIETRMPVADNRADIQ